MQESKYRVRSINRACGIKPEPPLAYDETCVWQDFGMAQINYKTAKKYKFNIDKLLFDEEYSINAGAIVLSWFHRKYAKKEATWFVRYNCGTARNTNRPTCNAYKTAVRRWL